MNNSASNTQTKLCRDCKHLAKSSVGDSQSWKCMAPENVRAVTTDLVTGEAVFHRRNINCYAARQESADRQVYTCGPEGLWFKEAPPKFVEPVKHTGATDLRAKNSAGDLLSQLDKM
jgi:hypothetical protein